MSEALLVRLTREIVSCGLLSGLLENTTSSLLHMTHKLRILLDSAENCTSLMCAIFRDIIWLQNITVFTYLRVSPEFLLAGFQIVLKSYKDK